MSMFDDPQFGVKIHCYTNELTTHFHLVGSLRTNRDYTSSSFYAFMAWGFIELRGHL
jgi:hypothetical protein